MNFSYSYYKFYQVFDIFFHKKQWIQKILQLLIQALLPSKIEQKMTSFQNSVQKNITHEPRSIIQKEIQIEKNRLCYSNIYYSKEIENPESKTNQIVVKNILCQKIDEGFKKTIQIQIGKKVIVLEDYYKLKTVPIQKKLQKKSPSEADTYNNDGLTSEVYQKNQDQQQDVSELEYKCNRRNDKKNIVKNIVKSFNSWLKQYNEDELQDKLLQSRNILQQLLKTMKFNNQLIISIVNNQKLCNVFQLFLKTAAGKWLNKSKINCKHSHMEAIQLYIKACTNGKIDNLRTIKTNANDI